MTLQRNQNGKGEHCNPLVPLDWYLGGLNAHRLKEQEIILKR